MRTMVAPERFRYSKVEEKSREGRVSFDWMGTLTMAMRFLPAWMMDSRV